MPADRPYLSGIAERKRDEARASIRLHPKQQRALAFLARVRDLRADLRGARNRFAADVENDVADLEAVIGGDAIRVTAVTTTPLPSDPATLLAGARVRPSFGTSLSVTSCSFCWFAACFSFGSVPSVNVTVFSWPSRIRPSLTAVPGASCRFCAPARAHHGRTRHRPR